MSIESSPYSGAVYHEAGYDAYATGCVFLRMVAKIMKRGIENTSRLDLLADELHPFASRIKLMRSDIPCMRLDDVDGKYAIAFFWWWLWWGVGCTNVFTQKILIM